MSKETKKKLPLTIVIITNRNDSRFFDSLRSAQIAEKVIVIDNNSNNDWKKLKKQYFFTVISHETPISSFAKIRNKVLEIIKTNWVLFLDSDETLGNTSKELELNKQNIKQIIINDLFNGVTITRKDIFLGKYLKFGETGSSKIIRMFKIDSGKFTRNVHEIALISGKIGKSNITILHFSHTSISNFLQSISKYSKMASNNEKTKSLENILKMIFYPLLKFIYNYIFKLGFLDGFRGLIYAIMMSLHSFFVRVFYYESKI